MQQLPEFVLIDVCGLVSQGRRINKLELFWLEVAMWSFWPNKASSCSMSPKQASQQLWGTPQQTGLERQNKWCRGRRKRIKITSGIHMWLFCLSTRSTCVHGRVKTLEAENGKWYEIEYLSHTTVVVNNSFNTIERSLKGDEISLNCLCLWYIFFLHSRWVTCC